LTKYASRHDIVVDKFPQRQRASTSYSDGGADDLSKKFGRKFENGETDVKRTRELKGRMWRKGKERLSLRFYKTSAACHRAAQSHFTCRVSPGGRAAMRNSQCWWLEFAGCSILHLSTFSLTFAHTLLGPLSSHLI